MVDVPSNEAQWDLFRTFEAVARHGTLTAASRILGVSQSTVSRHLAKLEHDAGSPLLLRGTPIQLTQRGLALLVALQPMVDAALSARAALQDTPTLKGQITITTVGEMVRWVLARQLATFCRDYPEVRLRILANNQVNSLAAGEADVALRMVRPERGELVARKLARETFGFFVSSTLPLGPEVPWLGLTGSLAHIPEQQHADRAFASRPAHLLVEDVEPLGIMVQAALGVAILPRQFVDPPRAGGARLVDVREVGPAQVGALDLGAVPSREIWMVVHRSKQHIPIVRAVMTWLESIFATRT